MPQEFHIDMSRPAERAVLLQAMNKLRGPYTITITQNRKLRSNPQLRLYFSLFVNAFQRYLAEQGQPFTPKFCHYLLKRRFLMRDVCDKVTGEYLGEEVRSLSKDGDVNVKEMSEYLDNVHEFLVSLGIDVPPMRRMEDEGNPDDHRRTA